MKLLSLALALIAGPTVAIAQIAAPAGAALRATLSEPGAYAMPVGPHNGDSAPVLRAEGEVTTRAWRIGGTGLSSYQIMLGLKQQVLDQGFEVLFECSAEDCGGYDFRFGTRVLPEPDMHVDLGDYEYLAARRPDEEVYTSILTSRSASSGFVQVIEVTPDGVSTAQRPGQTDAGRPPAPPVIATPPAALGSIGEAMESVGRYILADLRFDTGSSNLGDGQYDSLASLATYLKDHPDARVALVGHTDAVGPLSPNITISRQRAASVRNRLITDYGVPDGQITSDGIGFLAPIATNQSDAGRVRNRRVEAILISTE